MKKMLENLFHGKPSKQNKEQAAKKQSKSGYRYHHEEAMHQPHAHYEGNPAENFFGLSG